MRKDNISAECIFAEFIYHVYIHCSWLIASHTCVHSLVTRDVMWYGIFIHLKIIALTLSLKETLEQPWVDSILHSERWHVSVDQPEEELTTNPPDHERSLHAITLLMWCDHVMWCDNDEISKGLQDCLCIRTLTFSFNLPPFINSLIGSLLYKWGVPVATNKSHGMSYKSHPKLARKADHWSNAESANYKPDVFEL